MDLAGDRALISMRQGQHRGFPIWSKNGTVTIGGGWGTDFRDRTGVTEINAPNASGAGELRCCRM